MKGELYVLKPDVVYITDVWINNAEDCDLFTFDNYVALIDFHKG